MRILVVGAKGAIGVAACAELGSRHELVTAGRTSGDCRVDMANIDAVDQMYTEVGPVDAVIATAGDVRFCRLTEHTNETLRYGLQEKVMGQVNLVLAGLTRVRDAGSFTLTSGVLDRDPVRMGVGAALTNGALRGFVVGAAIEMPRQLRINVVSPGLLEESLARYGALFPGHVTVSSERVGLAYAKSVEGALTGQEIVVE